MSKKVFISYRREDAKWQAREIYRALTQVLPRDKVFMDVDSIPPGADFVDVLEGWVDECDIMLALIGTGWINVVDPKSGRRRLENPNDFVRIEVRRGLERKIHVVPVLLDGAPIPDVDQLPDDLKRLVRRNAEFVEHRTVDTDVERLIKRLGLGEQPPVPAPAISSVDRFRAEGRIKVDAKIIQGAPDGWFKPGNGKLEWFKDHEHGPEMVVVPPGNFMMGSPPDEPERESWRKGTESPQHKVTIVKPFAVGRHAITREQFATFVNQTGLKLDGGAFVLKGDEWEHDPKASWLNPGFMQTDTHPVVCIDWTDANAYAAWLSKATGKTYRLLSEAEREFATRAGTTTPFWWGTSISPKQANYHGNFIYAGGGDKGEWRMATVAVDSFEANPWGLFNVHGNVWEWCGDAWHDTYDGAPTDGSLWGGEDDRRVVRGGSWNHDAQYLRSALRFRNATGDRINALGFRLARTLNP